VSQYPFRVKRRMREANEGSTTSSMSTTGEGNGLVNLTLSLCLPSDFFAHAFTERIYPLIRPFAPPLELLMEGYFYARPPLLDRLGCNTSGLHATRSVVSPHKGATPLGCERPSV